MSEQGIEPDEQRLEYIAGEIEDWEDTYGVQLSEEAHQHIAAVAMGDLDEDGDPNVQDAFADLIEAHNEAVEAAESSEAEGGEELVPSPEVLAAAIRGDYGPRAEAEAAEMVGIDLVGDEDPGEDPMVGLDLEVAGLEERLGRKVTEGEYNRIVKGLSHGEMEGLSEGYLPNLAERHAEEFATHREKPDSRKALMAEVADEAIAEKNAEEVAPEPDDEDEARRARMGEAAEAIISSNGAAA